MATSNANLDSFGDRGPLLRWLVFTGLCVFAFVLLWRFGLIRLMVASDRTYLSSIIGLLYVAASMHCLWRTIMISREGDAARRGGAIIAAGSGGLDVDGDAVVVEGAGKLPPGLVSAHIHDLAVKARLQGPRRLDQTLLLRGLAGRLRGSNQFGAFASDTLMKLGLLGTIIGFIMMLAPIAGLDPRSSALLSTLPSLASGAIASSAMKNRNAMTCSALNSMTANGSNGSSCGMRSNSSIIPPLRADLRGSKPRGPRSG
jgi:hypothetical protein